MRLIVENKSQEKTGEFARQLMSQARQELTNATLEEKVLEFIKAVVIDKFSSLSVEEIETMLNLDSLKKSKVYQEAKEEGSLETKLKTIPRLIRLGLTAEQIAESLDLDVETVRENTQQ